VLVVALGLDTVARVRDFGAIPRGLPAPTLPHLADLSFGIITGALAVAALVLVQGVGVSEAAPNPDKSVSDPNRDFFAQGVGNMLSGLFRGMPVGGSVGQTALNVSAGARGRWAAIFSGLWMAVILIAFSGAVGTVAMPTLAAILIYAAVGSVRTGSLAAIMRTGRIAQVAVVATFVATLFLSVAAAVGFGVVLSLLMQLNREATDLKVVRLVPDDTGRFHEEQAPSTLESDRVLLLDVYGSLFYAGARTLQAKLPDPGHARHPAVVLRLRGRAMLGATSFAVLSGYAARLDEAGGRLYLSGIDPELLAQIRRQRTVERAGDVQLYVATGVIGEASLTAYHDAEDWLAATAT
jgi:SulP family sulfate permease